MASAVVLFPPRLQPAVSAFSRLSSGWLLHQSGSTQYGLVPVVHFRKESYANVVLDDVGPLHDEARGGGST